MRQLKPMKPANYEPDNHAENGKGTGETVCHPCKLTGFTRTRSLRYRLNFGITQTGEIEAEFDVSKAICDPVHSYGQIIANSFRECLGGCAACGLFRKNCYRLSGLESYLAFNF